MTPDFSANKEYLTRYDLMRLRFVASGIHPGEFSLRNLDSNKALPIPPDFEIATDGVVTYVKCKILVWETANINFDPQTPARDSIVYDIQTNTIKVKDSNE